MDEKELSGKTVAELKDMAKDLGIEHISAMKKAELVAAIAAKGSAPSGAASKAAAAGPKGGEKDIAALKKEKGSLKTQIAEAVAAGDRARTHQLRRRKAQIRRILNRARPVPPPKASEKAPATKAE